MTDATQPQKDALLTTAVLACLAAVGSAVIGVLVVHFFETPKTVGAFIACAVFAFAAIAANAYWSVATAPRQSDSKPHVAELTATPTDEPTQSATPSRDDPADEPETFAPSTPEDPAETDSGTYYLFDMPTRDTEKEGRPGQCTSYCTGFEAGAAHIGGSTYPRSYLMEVAADGRRSTAAWAIARSCSTFTAIVGINDDTVPLSRVSFEVSLDGQPSQNQVDVTNAEPSELSLDVSGVANLQIIAYASETDGRKEVDVVWGDAHLECTPGSLAPLSK